MCRLICIFGIFNSELKTNSKTIAMAKDMIEFINVCDYLYILLLIDIKYNVK